MMRSIGAALLVAFVRSSVIQQTAPADFVSAEKEDQEATDPNRARNERVLQFTEPPPNFDANWRAIELDGKIVWSVRCFVDLDLGALTEDARMLAQYWEPPDWWMLCFTAGLNASKGAFEPRCVRPFGSSRKIGLVDVPIWLPPSSRSRTQWDVDDQGSVKMSVWLERKPPLGAQVEEETDENRFVLGHTNSFLAGPRGCRGGVANVTTQVSGGLGNQLCQVFATMAYAIKYGLNFHFGNEFFRNQVPGSFFYRSSYWNSLLRALAGHLTDTPDHPDSITFDEDWFGRYRPLPAPPPCKVTSHITLNGPKQAYHYFDDFADTIIDKLDIEPQRSATCSNLQSFFLGLPTNPATTISVHFRIGDYKHIPDQVDILPVEYYRRSLQNILEALGQFQEDKKREELYVLLFFELQDQLEVRARVKLLEARFPELRFVWPAAAYSRPEGSEEDGSEASADVDLLSMSCCDHHVTANSTFSWWAAYLHLVLSRRIPLSPLTTYPDTLKRWASSQLLPKEDIYPSEWIGIAVD
jgi:hypothetical protein